MHLFPIIALLIAVAGIQADKCRVVRDTFMTCVEAQTSDLPNKSHPKVEWLTFTRSKIPKITKPLMKNYPKLTDLHAEHAEIESIDADSFAGLVTLNWVDVSINNIKEVNPDLFKSASNINHFNISGNTGLSIPKNKPFLHADALKWLDISSCGVREVYTETFSKMTTLRDLSLAHNLLQGLPEDIFKNNRGLLSLDLTDNKIKFLSDKVFLNLRTMVARFEENPWNCDCKLAPLLAWSKKNVIKGDVRCEKPSNKKWKELVNVQPCR